MPLPKKKKKKNYFEQLVLDLATYYDNAITKHAKFATIAIQTNKQTKKQTKKHFTIRHEKKSCYGFT